MTTHDAPQLPGTPCWADLTVSDLARSQEFYTKLFGWTYGESSADLNYYTNALVDGRAVAGLGPDMPGFDSPNVWTVYLATNDIAATHEAMLANGATAFFEPMQVAEFGQMGLWADPTGAVVGAWQFGSHTGYQVTGEPGAPTWEDLMTADIDRAKDFYAKVFGYRYHDLSAPGDSDQYYLIQLGDGTAEEDTIGGMGSLPSGDQFGSRWSIAFQVASVDATAGQVTDLGGQVVEQPWDFEFGRVAIISGPDGEILSVWEPGEDSE